MVFHTQPQYTFPKRIFTVICGIAIYTIIGTITYYLFAFTKTIAIALAILTPFITYFLLLKSTPTQPQNTPPTNKPTPQIFSTILSVLFTLIALIIFKNIVSDLSALHINEAIRTPWQYINTDYFINLGILTAISFTLARLGSRLALLTGSLTGIAILSVAIFVYQIGFGFDPFLHRAAEEFIAKNGAITPKSPYYIGQYVLVVALHHITGIAIRTIDLWLLPILTSLVPITIFAGIDPTNISRNARLTAALAFFSAPLAFAIATTPQGLANIFALLAIIAALTPRISSFIPIILALATAAIHPIVGIPVTLALIAIKLRNHKLKITALTLSAISVPSMFLANSLISKTASIAISKLSTPSLSTLLNIVNHRHYTLLTDAAYGWAALRPIIFLALAGIGVYYQWKNQDKKNSLIILVPFILLINALLLIIFRFPFLVATEQLNYSSRLTETALLLITPFALHTFAKYLNNIPRRAILINAAVITSLSALVVAATYINYPRVDTYTFTRGYSTSQHDVDAVKSIHDDVEKNNITSYAVLANQSVSAAAVHQYGFATYYQSKNGPIFFYPLPTSSPLYDIFLATNDTYGKPEVALRATQLIDVTTVYYVVNDYWWDAKRIISETKEKADRYWQPSENITIFVFTK